MTKNEFQFVPQRCPDCGTWLSTRYGAHRCPEPQPVPELAAPLRLELPKATKPDLAALPMAPQSWRGQSLPSERLAHAAKQAARYPRQEKQQNAPAATARAWALAWVCGALAGALVTVLVVSLLRIG